MKKHTLVGSICTFRQDHRVGIDVDPVHARVALRVRILQIATLATGTASDVTKGTADKGAWYHW